MTTYGAYSKTQIYSPKDIKELVLYARLRGVKIIPELDAPAHAGTSFCHNVVIVSLSNAHDNFFYIC